LHKKGHKNAVIVYPLAKFEICTTSVLGYRGVDGSEICSLLPKLLGPNLFIHISKFWSLAAAWTMLMCGCVCVCQQPDSTAKCYTLLCVNLSQTLVAHAGITKAEHIPRIHIDS